MLGATGRKRRSDVIDVRIHSTIVFEAQTVTKSFEKDIDLEFEKSQLLWNIGHGSGFRYPKPLRLDAEAGSIAFERIHTDGSIRQDYTDYLTATEPSTATLRMFEQLGRILAEIHNHLSLKARYDWQPSHSFVEGTSKAGCSNFATLVESLPKAFLHGDFGLRNVERIGPIDKPQLVVFDASPDRTSVFHTNAYGPVYVDIGMVMATLCGMMPFRYYPFVKWERVAILQRTFLNGYNQASSSKCEMETARIFSYGVASSYFTRFHKIMGGFYMRLLFNKLKGKMFV
jgi:hypothetical protein